MNPFSYVGCTGTWRQGGRLLSVLCALCGYGLLPIFFGSPSAASQPTRAGSTPLITLSAPAVQTGDTLLVEIDCRHMPAAVRVPVVSFGEQKIHLFPHPAESQRVFAGVVGIALRTRPGSAKLKVAWSDGDRRYSTSAVFTIRPGEYGEETLRVDPRHVRPSPDDIQRIRREQEELKKIYASGNPARLWLKGFQIPVPGEMNGPFGTRRTFNGELQSQHSGVDFRAQTGEPIHSAGSGVVCMARDLFYSGNAVIIDHGAGVFTSYSHLSRILVDVGQRVETGMVVGLAGSTGRATGPHLHWGVKVNGTSVNPLTFIRTIALLNAK